MLRVLDGSLRVQSVRSVSERSVRMVRVVRVMGGEGDKRRRACTGAELVRAGVERVRA